MPSLFVAELYWSPVRSFTIMISAPGIAFPSGSRTIPAIDPFGDWATSEPTQSGEYKKKSRVKVARTQKLLESTEMCTPVRYPGIGDIWYQLSEENRLAENESTMRAGALAAPESVSGIADGQLGVCWFGIPEIEHYG